MEKTTDAVLTVRIHAGFNAGALIAGLAALTDLSAGMAGAYLRRLFPKVDCGVALERRNVRGISGLTARILTPPEHAHRHPADIAAIYDGSRLTDAARRRADAVWRVLAEAEGRVHGMSPCEVHFHEVGRMSNILAAGLAAEFLETLAPARFVASPIPMNDGEVRCAHGLVPFPAPALFAMLEGVPVRPSLGAGELITPTGLALLKGLGAEFGHWPRMTVERAAQVFVEGGVFEGTPNGSRFVLGRLLAEKDEA